MDRLTIQGGFWRLIATTDFVILNLAHTDTLLKFKHMVFISNLQLDSEIFGEKQNIRGKHSVRADFLMANPVAVAWNPYLTLHMLATWTFAHIYQETQSKRWVRLKVGFIVSRTPRRSAADHHTSNCTTAEEPRQNGRNKQYIPWTYKVSSINTTSLTFSLVIGGLLYIFKICAYLKTTNPSLCLPLLQSLASAFMVGWRRWLKVFWSWVPHIFLLSQVFSWFLCRDIKPAGQSCRLSLGSLKTL